MKEIVASQDELGIVVAYLNDILPQDAIIFLHGDLASGKTTLTQAIARQKGIDSDVTSPTFSLQHIYGADLYHYDLYRIDMDEFVSLGLFEEFENSGWHLVEWGSDELKSLLVDTGLDVYQVSIEVVGDKRKYSIEKCG